MKARRITVYTFSHITLAVVFWFLLFGAVMGSGFSAELGVFDKGYYSFALFGTYLFALPALLLSSNELPGWVQYLVVPLQVIYSLISVNIAVFFIVLCKAHNKSKQAGTP